MATPTDQQILDAAQRLGDMIAQHPAAERLQRAIDAMADDIDAQRLITDYQRLLHALADKEAQGRPIEVQDKRKLEALQTAVVRSRPLRDLQTAQMDYLDLMRRVDQAINPVQDDAPHAVASPTNPDLSMGPGA